MSSQKDQFVGHAGRGFFVELSKFGRDIGPSVVSVVYETETRRDLEAKHHVFIRMIQFIAGCTYSLCNWRAMQLFEKFFICDLDSNR